MLVASIGKLSLIVLGYSQRSRIRCVQTDAEQEGRIEIVFQIYIQIIYGEIRQAVEAREWGAYDSVRLQPLSMPVIPEQGLRRDVWSQRFERGQCRCVGLGARSSCDRRRGRCGTGRNRLEADPPEPRCGLYFRHVREVRVEGRNMASHCV